METACELVVQSSLGVPFSTVYFLNYFSACAFSAQFLISEPDWFPFHSMKVFAQKTVLLIHKLQNFPAFEATKR